MQLRKASDRVRPQIAPKVDERDSLLEQIRSKVRASKFYLVLHAILTQLILVFRNLKLIIFFFSPST